MTELREIERKIYSCPEIDERDLNRYPYVGDEDYNMMIQAFCEDESVGRVFVFVRDSDVIHPFIDIYIWDLMQCHEGCKRFIIAEGYCMHKTQEDFLFDYLNKEHVRVDRAIMQRLYEDVKRVFPEWHYIEYHPLGITYAIQHLYFSSFRSGPREILFKAGLTCIASHIEQVKDYNLFGTTPSSIVGNNLPMGLLRLINRRYTLFQALGDSDEMSHIRGVYEVYSGYMGKHIPSYTQWDYLDRLYRNDGEVGGHGFMRSLYNRLEDGDDESILYYESFLKLRDKYDEFRKLRLPKVDDIEDVVIRLETYDKCLMEDEQINEKIADRKKASLLEYTGTAYSVIMPENARDFIREGMKQGNCVVDYLQRHADGEISILFLRKNDAPDKPFVTMEISDGVIEQALARYNTKPSDEVRAFLNEYATEKNLRFDRRKYAWM